MPAAVGDCTGAFMMVRACAEAAAEDGAAADMLLVPEARRGAAAVGEAGPDEAALFNATLPAGEAAGETRGRLAGEEAAHTVNWSRMDAQRTRNSA